MLNCDEVQAARYSCISALNELLRGGAIVLQGSMSAVAATLARISRIIECSSHLPTDKCQVLARCVVRIVRGKPEQVNMSELPCTYWPDVYAQIMESSFAHPTYVPAHLVWSVYAGIFGRFHIAAGEWLGARFSDGPITHNEPFFGFRLRVPPRVFIPDPAVIDVLLGAYFSPQSPLPVDLESIVVEPCTGSGILGMAVAALGASRIIASDIDRASVQCAQRNVIRNGLREQITIVRADGLPDPHEAPALLVNPPWHDRDGGRDLPDAFRRCLMDPGRRLLARLLHDAADHHIKVAYVFLGTRNPFVRQPDDNTALEVFPGWRKARTWRSPHGIHLYRLVRKVGDALARVRQHEHC